MFYLWRRGSISSLRMESIQRAKQRFAVVIECSMNLETALVSVLTAASAICLFLSMFTLTRNRGDAFLQTFTKF